MFWTNDINLTKKSQRSNPYSMCQSQRYSDSSLGFNLPELKQSKDKDLKQKVNKFIAINKNHQLDQICVCQDCIYAKQLGRYQLMKLDLSKNSTYKSQYNKHLLKRSLNNTIDLTNSTISKKSEQSNIIKAKNIHSGSNYNHEFASKSLQKIQKLKPIDELKFKGPTINYSSYKAQYKNHNGPYQYLEPIKKQLLPSIKFNYESLYSDSYKNSKMIKTDSQKIPDQLRLGKISLVKQSTNKSLYNAPNPQLSSLLNKKQKSLEKRIQTPNFSFQFRTINTNQFSQPIQKKNCRNKRLQSLNNQLTLSMDLSQKI